MTFTSRLTLGALIVLAAAGLARDVVSAAQNPIQVEQCFVTEPKPMSKLAGGTQIMYVNRGSKAATHVTFTVGYRNSSTHYLRKVTDDGNFAPNTTINHHFDLYNDVTYGGKKTQSCNATYVKFYDGTHWSA